jgi:hypothetical protein
MNNLSSDLSYLRFAEFLTSESVGQPVRRRLHPWQTDPAIKKPVDNVSFPQVTFMFTGVFRQLPHKQLQACYLRYLKIINLNNLLSALAT